MNNFFHKYRKFLLIVMLPTFIVGAYFSLIATPVYRSMTTFIVTNPNKDTGGFSAFLSGGTGDSMTGAFLIKDFTESWGEYKALDSLLNLAKFWQHGDVISSYINWVSNDIILYNYYKSHVETSIDKRSGIVSVSTYAYSSRDAKLLASQILHDAEDRINYINRQKDVDMTTSAQRQLDEAKRLVAADNKAMEVFRRKTGYYKPDLDYNATLQTQSNIAVNIAKAKADYSSVSSETPNNPVIGGLKDQLSSFSKDAHSLNKARASINAVAKEYDALESKRNLDLSMMEKAGQVLQETVLKSSSDRYYLQVISEPSAPSAAEFPRALLITFSVFMILLIGYRFILV